MATQSRVNYHCTKKQRVLRLAYSKVLQLWLVKADRDLRQLLVLKYLHMEKIDLSFGGRTVAPGGKYFSKYKIVLPYGDDLKEDIDVLRGI